MLSDLHFDPFRDPAKVPALRSAPVMQWSRILNDPDSITQAADFAALQTACKSRGADSSWAVVKSTLAAAHTQQPAPLFITVSGDLLTHNFDCRMKTLDKEATAEQISDFAEKTIAFLASEMRQSFGGTPTYLALGNNDSGCTDYHQTVNSRFVKNTALSLASGFTRPQDQKVVVQAFSSRGDYSVLLPHSMHGTRLVVLQNVFGTPRFAACESEETAGAVPSATAQMDWLREQLAAARREHQKVWVMAHIPPGVDTYASFHKFVGKPEGMCSVASPVMMLNSDDLTRLLTDYAGEVKLALFAHTHMDEIKLLHNPQGASIPAKLIPSVSPINGNTPSFLLATVQPQTATMLDYAVYAASDSKASSWSEEYRYSGAYHMPDFSADSVGQLATRMERDKDGTDEISVTYQRWFLPGDDGKFARGLKTIWPSYACAISENGGPLYRRCMCPADTTPRAAGGQ